MRQISRRDFLEGATVLTLAAHPWLTRAKGATMRNLLLVGTQTKETSKGIYVYSFDAGTGELKQLGLAAETEMPTFLALSPDKKTLVAANELEEYQGKKGGAVTSFALDHTPDGQGVKLTKVDQVASQGGATCHVAVDHTGRCAFAANYSGGSAASFALEGGTRLSPIVSFEQYSGHGPNADRQAAPHAHRVTVSPDNKYLLVNDLGLDKIHIYRLDAATAKLTPNDPPAWNARPGSGPRALRFHPNGRWAYCVNELKSTVDVLNWDGERGALTTAQEVDLLAPGYKGDTRGCDIVFDHTARFAYVANRDDDFMATFTVSPDNGHLTFVNRTSCGGKIPRHFTLDPSERWLLVANQESDNIAVFARDANTGHLADTGKSFAISKPQCLVFL